MKTYFGKLSFVLLLLMMLSGFAGCGNQNAEQTEHTLTFTDALGRSVTVSQEPKRVAALLGSFADVWVLSGGSVCATAEDAWEDFELELEDAVSLGGAHSPNLELLLSAEPDFVLASASTASNLEMREILEAAEIPVAYFDIDHFEDYLQMLSICTDITGRKDLYEKNGLAVQRKIDAVRTGVSEHGLTDQERTVLLLRASSGFVKAKGSTGTILGEMLQDLDCINIADSDVLLLENLSVESVIRQNPQHIFVVTMGNDTEKALYIICIV